ncbi:MAG: AMP-binding protein, partial [Acidimicrobiales bacterium]
MLDFASVWEHVTDTVPGYDALVYGRRRITYREFDDGAARLASALAKAGVGEGAKVALYLHNCPEYLIAQYGAFKHRAVPVNVNYRYLDEELVYLIENSDAEALVFHSSLAPCVERVRTKLSALRILIEVDDDGSHLEGAWRFDELLAAHEPQARKARSPEDLYMLYTGGTTGMPKGVMFHQGEFIEKLFVGAVVLGVVNAVPHDATSLRAVLDELTETGRVVSVTCCPLMHGTGMWIGAMPALMTGGTVVLLESRPFDADEVWRLVERERATRIVIVGDPFARPLLRALRAREDQGRPVDTSSVEHVLSSGAIWSAEIKDQLRSRMTAVLSDSLGSTEGLGFGASRASHTRGAATAHFALTPETKVVDDEGRSVEPGSGVAGVLASRSAAFGYYKDPEKTARTFVMIDGERYVLTGDWATVDADGAITLLGRGSMTVNTGGEKVFAEEVEEAIKRHPLVEDCLVVGVADERFGQRVVAVIASTAPPAPSREEIGEFLRPVLAHYKIPKDVVVGEFVQRAPNGKADYAWALRRAMAREG